MKTSKTGTLTVETYQDKQLGISRSARALFDYKYPDCPDEPTLFKLRSSLKLQPGDRIVCGSCGRPLKICGGLSGKRSIYFCHFQGGDKDCIYYLSAPDSRSHLVITAKKFFGRQAGPLHEGIKHFVADTINGMPGAEAVEEQVMHSLDNLMHPRRPDITARFQPQAIGNDTPLQMALEIQLSTTFLDVILGRTEFYRLNKTYLLWIFDRTFSACAEEQKFSQKDVMANSMSNAFVLDDEAKERSLREGRLVLNCYFYKYRIKDGKVVEDGMANEYITLDQLTFRETDYKVFYKDDEESRRRCLEAYTREQEERLAQRDGEKTESDWWRESMEQQEREEREGEYWRESHEQQINQAFNEADGLLARHCRDCDARFDTHFVTDFIIEKLRKEFYAVDDTFFSNPLVEGHSHLIAECYDDWHELMMTSTDRVMVTRACFWLFSERPCWLTDMMTHDGCAALLREVKEVARRENAEYRAFVADHGIDTTYPKRFYINSAYNLSVFLLFLLAGTNSQAPGAHYKRLLADIRPFVDVISILCGISIYSNYSDNIPQLLNYYGNRRKDCGYAIIRACEFKLRNGGKMKLCSRKHPDVLAKLRMDTLGVKPDKDQEATLRLIFPRIFTT